MSGAAPSRWALTLAVVSALCVTIPAGAASTTRAGVRSTLASTQSLVEGASIQSANSNFTLVLQYDGDLVLTNKFRVVLWANHVIVSSPSAILTLQLDGNLVETGPGGTPLWSTHSAGSSANELALQDDGNLVLLSDHEARWSSGTGGDSSLPRGFAATSGTQQVVMVTSRSSSSSTATVGAFALTGGQWLERFAAMPASAGARGWSTVRQRREGDRTTPIGTFAMGPVVYGTAANPGTSFAYHQLVPGDYWDENPKWRTLYNTFQHSTNTDCARNPFGGDTECLWSTNLAYRYFAVVEFNSPATGPYGSAIFVHPDTGPTAGCVGVPVAGLVALLKWLSPLAHPRFVLAGPTRTGLI